MSLTYTKYNKMQQRVYFFETRGKKEQWSQITTMGTLT